MLYDQHSSTADPLDWTQEPTCSRWGRVFKVVLWVVYKTESPYAWKRGDLEPPWPVINVPIAKKRGIKKKKKKGMSQLGKGSKPQLLQGKTLERGLYRPFGNRLRLKGTGLSSLWPPGDCGQNKNREPVIS